MSGEADDDRPLEPPTIPKPNELLALHGVTEELFDTLRSWFDVPDAVTVNLEDIDSAVTELGDPRMIAALAMRKVQALRLLSTPGVRTTTDVVVSIVNDLDRALLQAPVMRLRVRAAATDWDAEFALLEAGEPLTAVPDDVSERDPEVDRFRTLHAHVHRAALAVVHASEGEIRILE
ncbi:MAG: hypothetical protein ACRD29_10715 [Acidimicrobiales bacterium]